MSEQSGLDAKRLFSLTPTGIDRQDDEEGRYTLLLDHGTTGTVEAHIEESGAVRVAHLDHIFVPMDMRGSGAGNYLTATFIADSVRRNADMATMSASSPYVIDILGKFIGEDSLHFSQRKSDGSLVELPITVDQARESVIRSRALFDKITSTGEEPSADFETGIHVSFDLSLRPESVAAIHQTLEAGPPLT